MKKNTRFYLKNANTLTSLSIGIFMGLTLTLASFWAGRAWQSQQSLAEQGFDLPSPAVDFTLMAATGEAHSIRAMRGKVILLSFGASTCDQPCEDMLSKLADARTNLESDAALVHVIILALDSEQDSPAELAQYVQNFDPVFLALSGSQRDLGDIAHSYNIFYATVEDYQPVAILIDPDGQWQKVYSLETSVKEIIADIQYYLSNR